MEDSVSPKKKGLALAAFIITTVLWGTSFIITKTITKELPIFVYLTLRYSIAIIGIIPILYRFKGFNKKILYGGIITGILYFISIVFQTYGLQTTTAGKAGFITGLGTVLVPFMTWFAYKKKVKLRVWIAVVLSTVGMGFLLLEGESGVFIGDMLVLVCAVFYAIFIVVNDNYVKKVDVYLFSFVQLATLSILCLGSSFLLSENWSISSNTIDFWLVMLYMGLIVTTVTFLFQNYGQQYLTPAKTAIIFTLEPVFAAFFGFLFGNELLSVFGLIGATIIFIALLITVIKNE
ncbi:MAG: DMT family transporter [Candidatus Lokiarchaeota archaeon]|nr:DMT family transporter [Candidatus Lokiarchaeota archaeon]